MPKRKNEKGQYIKGKMFKKICLICNKPFYVIPYRKDEARFCSKKCKGIFFRKIIPYKILYQKYIIEKKSAIKTADEFSCNEKTVIKNLKSYKIPMRNNKETQIERYKDSKLMKRVIERNRRINHKLWHDKKYEKYRKKFIKMVNSKEHKEKVIKSVLKALRKRPTKLESKFIELFEKHNLPFRYCGNGSLLIGYKNPDFVENNGKKICIEVSNKFYKEKFDNRNYDSWKDYEKERIKHFAKYGWKCLVLWDEELRNENELVKKIKRSGVIKC